MATFPLKPAAGRSLGVTYKLAKLPEATPCQPTPLTVGWFTESTGQFSETSEAAYLLPEPDTIGGPVLAVAGLMGTPCAEVQWVTSWDADSGDSPGIYQDGQRLVVYPVAGMSPGLLTAWVVVSGRRYGPIVLTVLRYDCAGYYCYGGSTALNLSPLTWNNGEVDIEEVNPQTVPDTVHLSVVQGTWPEGTVFTWSVSTLPDGFRAVTNHNTLAIIYYYGATGSMNASVTATTPGSETQTVGAISLAVFAY